MMTSPIVAQTFSYKYVHETMLNVFMSDDGEYYAYYNTLQFGGHLQFPVMVRIRRNHWLRILQRRCFHRFCWLRG